MRTGNLLFVIGTVLALAASGCGKNNSKDAGEAAGALTKAMKGSRSFAFGPELQRMRKVAEGQMLLQRFDAEAHAALTTYDCSTFSSETSATCNAGSVTVTNADGSTASTASCTGSCTSSTLNVACTVTGEMTEKCGTDTFTFKNGSLNVSVPAATCTASGSNITLAFSFGMDFKMDVKGGGLADFTRLECAFSDAFSISFDSTTGQPGSSTSDISGSGSFSCTLGGSTISQDDLAKAMSENAC